MARRLRLLTPCLLLALLAGCGSGNPRLIAESRAQELTSNVDRAAEAARAGDCQAAQRAVDEAQADLAGLPQRTDRRLRANLEEWLVHLEQEVAQTCQAQQQPEASPTPAPTPTPTPAPTPEPEASPTPTPEAPEEPEDEEGQGGEGQDDEEGQGGEGQDDGEGQGGEGQGEGQGEDGGQGEEPSGQGGVPGLQGPEAVT